MSDSYKYQAWRWGFIGRNEPHPLRRVQALIRARAAEAERDEREAIMRAIADRLDRE